MRCPHCSEPVGREDYQCPRCELVLQEAPQKPRPRREVSVVRAIMERPRSVTRSLRPKRPDRTATSDAIAPALDRVLHVAAELRLESLNLHPYDAWVVSLVDGRSTGAMLAAKLDISVRELQGVLQALIERGVLGLGERRQGELAPPVDDALPTQTYSVEAATLILDRANLLAAAAGQSAPKSEPSEGRRATGARREALRAPLGSEQDDEESTVTHSRPGRPEITAPGRGQGRIAAAQRAPPAPPVRAPAAKSSPREPSRPPPPQASARPVRPPSPSAQVPRPTLGIEDVDAQGALQVALQMEQAGRMEEAVGYLERAIARSPDAAPLYNRLAVILMRDFDDLVGAGQLLGRALELAPGHPVFTRNLKTVQQRQRGAPRSRR